MNSAGWLSAKFWMMKLTQKCWLKNLVVCSLSIPDTCGFLTGLLYQATEDGIYNSSFPEGLSFSLAYLDNFPEDVYRDYYDVAIREIHRSGGPGDPNTAPIVDRFRIYDRGEIIWFNPVIGMFVPYAGILDR